MGCGEDKLMAQQVQETVHKIRKEGRELPWPGATVMQYHNIQKDNFGIGSKSSIQRHNIKVRGCLQCRFNDKV